MNDCSQHKKDLLGETDMKKVAEAIADLHYEQLHYLFFELHKKFKKDSRRDWRDRKVQLSSRLKNISEAIKIAYIASGEAWQISKPFMQ